MSKRVPLPLGASLVGQLMDVVQRKGVTVWLEAPFENLFTESSEVLGAVIIHEGRTLRIKANAGVVLAVGGFSRNAEIRRRYQPVGGDSTGTGEVIPAMPSRPRWPWAPPRP
jgi:aspartate oxidase